MARKTYPGFIDVHVHLREPGATYPEELGEIREVVGDMDLLIPGIGAQGGDVEATVNAGKNGKGTGMLINSSRGIIFSEHPKRVAMELRDQINAYRSGIHS